MRSDRSGQDGLETSLFLNSDIADEAEAAGSGFALTLASSTSPDLRMDDLGKAERPEVVPRKVRLVVRGGWPVRQYPEVSARSASSQFP